MRQIGRCSECAPHGLFAVFEQGVQIINERLNLGGVLAFDPPPGPAPNAQKLLAQPAERRQTLAQCDESRGHRKQPRGNRQWRVL